MSIKITQDGKALRYPGGFAMHVHGYILEENGGLRIVNRFDTRGLHYDPPIEHVIRLEDGKLAIAENTGPTQEWNELWCHCFWPKKDAPTTSR